MSIFIQTSNVVKDKRKRAIKFMFQILYNESFVNFFLHKNIESLKVFYPSPFKKHAFEYPIEN